MARFWLSRRSRRSFLAPLALAVAVASAPGCDACGSDPAPIAPAAPAALSPVAAPSGLQVEIVLPTPDTTWKSIQGMVGGVLALAAPTFSGLVGATAGAPGLSGPVESNAPAYVVVGGGPGLHWAVAFRANEAAALSWAGADAGTFVRATKDEAEMRIFEPVRPDGPAVGIAPGNFLVVATSRDDLVQLGPYAFRTLPSRPLPKEPAHVTLTKDGIGALAGVATRRWAALKADLLAKDEEQRQAHGGRAPDHGDPRALVAAVDGWIGAWLDAVRDLGSADVGLESLDGVLALELLGTAGGPGSPSATAIAGLHPGEMRALEAAPAGALFAIEARSDAAERTKTAVDWSAAGVNVFRLPPAEQKELAAELGAWADARGDELVFGFEPSARAVFVRTAVRDEGAATKAFDLLVKRVDGGSFRDLFRGALDVASVQKTTVVAPGVGSGTLVAIERRVAKPTGDAGAPAGRLPAKLGLFYTAQRGELVATAAEDAPAATAGLFAAKRLVDDARVKDALARVRGRAALVMVSRPLLATATPQNDATIFALGRDGDRAMLRLEVTGAILRDVVRQVQTEGL